MEWKEGTLILLDQTRLPLEVTWISCTTAERVREAIARLEVRGAPAIGAAAAFAMVLGWRSILQDGQGSRDLPAASCLSAFAAVKARLDSARPTAINLAWATNRLYKEAARLAGEGQTAEAVGRRLESLAQQLYEQDIAVNKAMGRNGAACVPDDAVILTHCNAGALATCGWGTALGVIRSAAAEGKVRQVYADETRPLLQGARLTVWELMEDGIPVTAITDNMAAWVMKKKGVNFVVTGADRIVRNGDTANKIGTYGVALLAKAHGIPFYVAAPASTFDFRLASGEEIPIEERDGEEVRRFCGKYATPPKAPVFNPAFDVTPASLITGIITEYGVLRPPYPESIQALQARILKEEQDSWKA
jgi:methylthioribose-1-phosphate isomerase